MIVVLRIEIHMCDFVRPPCRKRWRPQLSIPDTLAA